MATPMTQHTRPTPARRAAEAACDLGDLYGSTSACPALPRRRPGVQCTPRLWPSKIVPILALSPFGDLFRGNKPPAHQSAFRDEFPTVKGYSKRVLTVLAVAEEAMAKTANRSSRDNEFVEPTETISQDYENWIEEE